MTAWLLYLLTEPWIIGSLAWVAIIIGVPSLWIAIAQLKKVRTATEATNEALRSFKGLVREHDVTNGFQQAVLSLSGAMHSMAGRNYEAAALQLDAVATVLVVIREIEGKTQGGLTGDILLRIRSERELLGTFIVGAELTGRAATSGKRLRAVRGEVEQQLARSRLKFVKEA